jgi:perosamine synthetase
MQKKVQWWECSTADSDKILINKCLKSNWPNEGKYNAIFEKKIKRIIKAKYAITCTSGTAAIFLSLKALGVGPNDEVIVPNITFIATANAVKMTGAKVILVDISKENLLINEKDLLKKITKKTKVIIAVHISGRGDNITEIKKIAKKKKIFLIEDAAEALFSSHKKKFYGTFGDAGCFSFSPNKIITTGQGGLIVTQSKNVYLKIKRFKNQGRSGVTTGGDDLVLDEGFNFKFTDLQSALGLSQLKFVKKRQKILINIYNQYKKNLNKNKKFYLYNFNLKELEYPLWIDAYCSNRDELVKYLNKRGINTRNFWHPLNTTLPYKKNYNTLPNSKKLNKKLLWLPCHFLMKKSDVKFVCKTINNFFLKKNECRSF